MTCYSAKLGSVRPMHRKAHPLTRAVGKDRTAFIVAPDEGSGQLVLRRPGLLRASGAGLTGHLISSQAALRLVGAEVTRGCYRNLSHPPSASNRSGV